MALAGLSVADALVSSVLIGLGRAAEANPLMHLGLAHLGLAAMLALKLTVTACAAGLIVAVRREVPHTLPHLVWAANAAYAVLLAGGLALSLAGMQVGV